MCYSGQYATTLIQVCPTDNTQESTDNTQKSLLKRAAGSAGRR